MRPVSLRQSESAFGRTCMLSSSGGEAGGVICTSISEPSEEFPRFLFFVLRNDAGILKEMWKRQN